MNMKVNIAGVEWKNPVTVASGTFGSGAEFADYVDLNRLGAVTTKGVADVPWTGNPTPRVAETYGGMMNAVGLQNPGIDLFCERDIPFLRKYDTKIIVNVCGAVRGGLLRGGRAAGRRGRGHAGDQYLLSECKGGRDRLSARIRRLRKRSQRRSRNMRSSR